MDVLDRIRDTCQEFTVFASHPPLSMKVSGFIKIFLSIFTVG